jgi:hypothetical protein
MSETDKQRFPAVVAEILHLPIGFSIVFLALCVFYIEVRGGDSMTYYQFVLVLILLIMLFDSTKK